MVVPSPGPAKSAKIVAWPKDEHCRFEPTRHAKKIRRERPPGIH
jgi:hypothetical protein